MSQKIYLDDCAYAKELVHRLEAAGHQVTTPKQAGILGMDDHVHFDFAARLGLVLLTKNPSDYLALHDQNPQHAGLLLVYQDNNPDRDMNHAEIVQALANVEASGIGFAGQAHVLNAWRFTSA